MTDEIPKLTKEQYGVLQQAAVELFNELNRKKESKMIAGGLIMTECDCCRRRKFYDNNR